MTAPEVPDLTNATAYAYCVAAEDPERDRGERWFVLGEEVWYRRAVDAELRKAMIPASTLETRPTWAKVES